MKEIIIYNDNHWGSPISIENTIGYFIEDCKLENCYSLGDNFDLANCSKSDVDYYEKMRIKFKDIMGSRLIDGNHSRVSITNDSIVLEHNSKKIVMVHGDFESWKPDKAIAYRSKAHGASWFKRLFTKAWNDFYDAVWNRKIDSAFLDRCSETLDQHEGQILIMGHRHLKKTEIFNHGEHKIVILKRGRNVIQLDSL